MLLQRSGFICCYIALHLFVVTEVWIYLLLQSSGFICCNRGLNLFVVTELWIYLLLQITRAVSVELRPPPDRGDPAGHVGHPGKGRLLIQQDHSGHPGKENLPSDNLSSFFTMLEHLKSNPLIRTITRPTSVSTSVRGTTSAV